MSLLLTTINNEIETLQKNNIGLMAIGDIASLPGDVRENLNSAIEKTSGNTGTKLVLALSYSGRWEISEAVKGIVNDVLNKKIDPSDIDQCLVEQYLNTTKIPDPELLIRTSGENRISNFLLWQLAYCEFYFTPTLWPDFRKEHLYEAIINFQNRERRFGKTSEQICKEDEQTV
jgi:undecaprenyl diphosphate synthase